MLPAFSNMPTNLTIIQTASIAPHEVRIGDVLWLQNTSKEPFTLFGKSIYKELGISYAKYFKMDALARLGFLAAELVSQSIEIENFAVEKVAQVLSNASSTIDIDTKYTESMASIPSPAQFVYTLPNIMMGEIAIRHGIRGENIFLVSQLPEANQLYFAVSDLFAKGTTDLCFTGWIEFVNKTEYSAKMMLVGNHEQNADEKAFTFENLNNFLQ